MQINDNQRKRLYDKESRTWYEVSAKQYKEFDQWRTNAAAHVTNGGYAMA